MQPRVASNRLVLQEERWKIHTHRHSSPRTRLVATGALCVLGAFAHGEEPEFQDPALWRDPWPTIREMDSDGDGEVTQDEFTGPDHMFRGFDLDGDGLLEEEEVTGRRRERERLHTEKRWIFERFDLDGDGDVDAADQKALLGRFDADGDGKLDGDEFLQFVLSEDRPLPGGEAPKKGATSPSFELRRSDSEDGKTLSLDTVVARGRPVVVVFGSFT